jgi:predicted oxidoreductase
VQALANAFPIVSHQVEFSAASIAPMLDGIFDQCLATHLAALVWSPLAGGRLATGEGLRPPLLGCLDVLAQREGVDRATIALAFALAHPVRAVVVVGTMNAQRLKGVQRALHVTLTRSDVYDIVEASTGAALP